MDNSIAYNHGVLGDIYLYQRQYDEAIKQYKKAMSLNPNEAYMYWYLGRALFFTGKKNEAIPLLRKSMRLHPHYPWLFPGVLFKVYYHSGRYEDALSMFEQIFEKCQEGACNPKWGHLYLSMVLVDLGRADEARFHMQKLLEHDPRFNIEDRRKRNLYRDQAMNEREMAALLKARAPEHPPSQCGIACFVLEK